MPCWLRFQRHTWGGWVEIEMAPPLNGVFAFLQECQHCGALTCRVQERHYRGQFPMVRD